MMALAVVVEASTIGSSCSVRRASSTGDAVLAHRKSWRGTLTACAPADEEEEAGAFPSHCCRLCFFSFACGWCENVLWGVGRCFVVSGPCFELGVFHGRNAERELIAVLLVVLKRTNLEAGNGGMTGFAFIMVVYNHQRSVIIGERCGVHCLFTMKTRKVCLRYISLSHQPMLMIGRRWLVDIPKLK